MRNDEAGFTKVYEGPMNVVWRGERIPDSSPIYYRGEVGFEFERTNRRALDKPTITISIPVTMLVKTGDDSLKRLRYFFTKMDEKTTTYTYRDDKYSSPPRNYSFYDGQMQAVPQPKSDGEPREPELVSDPTFWRGECAYTLERSNKLSPDKPTVVAAIPADKLGLEELDRAGQIAAADALLREFARFIEPYNAEIYNRSRPDTENGRYYIHEPGGEVLMRNSAYFAVCRSKDYQNGSAATVYILPEEQLKPPQLCFCMRVQVQLPEKKLKRAMKMLCGDLPQAVEDFIEGYDRGRVLRAIELAGRQTAIRAFLRESEYCAFVANGAILPRECESEKPMTGAIPFKSVPEDEIEVAGVRGMGIKRGVTVITGGGYSGKSTLLDAISAGIYNHCEGDGRELVICDDSAVDITAEDGRCVKNVNISPFIKWLPGGDTRDFSTARASGSTSQAANIMEAADSGARLLLIDEDRSATNFMIRDEKMKRLIEREPITPFTDRVRELSERGVSTILVIGGSGEYLSVSDRVYLMEDYLIRDVTSSARELSGITDPVKSEAGPADWALQRGVYDGFSSYPEGGRSERLEFSETGFIIFGSEMIDTRVLHNLATPAQANAIGFILRELAIASEGEVDFPAALSDLYARIEREGLDCVFSSWFCNCPRFMDLPRPAEVAAALNRMRRVSRPQRGLSR